MPRASAGMATASAGFILSELETRVYKKWSGGARRATTFCRMSSGGDELFWHGGRHSVLVLARRVRRERQVKCAAGGGGRSDLQEVLVGDADDGFLRKSRMDIPVARLNTAHRYDATLNFQNFNQLNFLLILHNDLRVQLTCITAVTPRGSSPLVLLPLP